MTEEQKNVVVVGVDGSEDGMRAVDFGVREALSKDARLLLAHAVDDAVLAGAWGVVYDPTLLEEAGQEAADAAKARALAMDFPEDRLESKIFMGNPGAILTKLSEEARTLVVGRRALSGLERLFVGSTSVGVAATAHCPTIMVSAATHRPKTGDLNVIGAGVQEADRCLKAIKYALAEASHRGARVELLHAFELPMTFFGDRKNRADRERDHEVAARQALVAAVEPLRKDYPDVQVDLTVVAGHPVEQLTEWSNRLDLLVLEVHGGVLPGFSPGATIRGVMAHSHCPLALVRKRDQR
jgi:nucleotide-binding universal stress UspA family protein